MFILGLTGSIGMGKSATARIFKRLRIPVHDADASVHRLMGPRGTALDVIDKRFPGVVGSDGVNRKKLGDQVFDDTTALADLEAILHPMVRQSETDFLKSQALRGETLVVLDIPLLFETDGENRMDAVTVVTAPAFLQRQRVMVRDGMTAEKFDAILAKQMPDVEKRFLADFVIQTGLGHRRALMDVQDILDRISGVKGRHWPRRSIQIAA